MSFQGLRDVCRARARLAGHADPDRYTAMDLGYGGVGFPAWVEHLKAVEGLVLPTWPLWKRLAYRVWAWRNRPGPGHLVVARCPHGHADWDTCPVCCH